MISIMTSKWVGDALGKDGIYTVWIAMRRYPWLPPANYRDSGESAASLMKPLSRVVVIEDGVTTVGELQDLLKTYDFHGFPITDSHTEFVGYATKQELITALGENFRFLLGFSL
jgi:chloride channel 3/4/5